MNAPDGQPSVKPCSPSNAGQLTSERSSGSSSKASKLNPSRISMLLPNANLAAYSKRVSSEVTKRVAEKFVAPGPSQVLLLAHSIAAKGHRGLSQAAEASASLSPTSRIKLMQVLCGIVVMVHAFLLPYRAVFSMLGLDAEERALDSEYFVSFAMTLYPLDALFILFRAAPHISRVILERQQLLAQAMLQNALSLVTPVTEEKSDDEEDTQEANSCAPSDDNICAAGVGGSAKSLPSGCKRPSSAISVQQQWLESACAKSEEKAGSAPCRRAAVWCAPTMSKRATGTGANKVGESEHGAGPAHHVREESDLTTSMRSHEKSTPLLSFSFKSLLLLACILPWDLIPLFAGASVRTWCETQVLRVVRLYWCFPAADALAWLLRYRGHTSVARARLLSFIPLLFLVLHLITCAWQAAGDDVTGQSGWQTNDVLLVGRLNDTSALYVRGIWWTSVTFVTIGFGDIVPTQLSEMNICMFVEYVGLLTVCVIVGLLTADITATDVMASSWQQRVDTASSFARSRKLSRKVSQRIHQYLQYQWTYLRGVDEASFFVGLPAALRSEVLVALNDHLIRNIPYFAKGSDALIAQLAGLLFPLLFLPEECLYSEGQSAVYTSLVVRGKVQEIKYVKMQERKRMVARPWSPRNWTPRPSVHYGSPQSMSKPSSKRKSSSDSGHVCTGRAFCFGFPRMRSISGEHLPSRRNLEEGVNQSPTVDNKTPVRNAAENARNGQREVEASDEGRGVPSDVEVAARREKKAASTSGAVEAGLQSEASSPCLVARHRSISAQPDVPGVRRVEVEVVPAARTRRSPPTMRRVLSSPAGVAALGRQASGQHGTPAESPVRELRARPTLGKLSPDLMHASLSRLLPRRISIPTIALHIRYYTEGDCVLPEATLRSAKVRHEFKANTFVEVHALHFEDVTRLLQDRIADSAAEKERKIAAARAPHGTILDSFRPLRSLDRGSRGSRSSLEMSRRDLGCWDVAQEIELLNIAREAAQHAKEKLTNRALSSLKQESTREEELGDNDEPRLSSASMRSSGDNESLPCEQVNPSGPEGQPSASRCASGLLVPENALYTDWSFTNAVQEAISSVVNEMNSFSMLNKTGSSSKRISSPAFTRDRKSNAADRRSNATGTRRGRSFDESFGAWRKGGSIREFLAQRRVSGGSPSSSRNEPKQHDQPNSKRTEHELHAQPEIASSTFHETPKQGAQATADMKEALTEASVEGRSPNESSRERAPKGSETRSHEIESRTTEYAAVLAPTHAADAIASAPSNKYSKFQGSAKVEEEVYSTNTREAVSVKLQNIRDPIKRELSPTSAVDERLLSRIGKDVHMSSCDRMKLKVDVTPSTLEEAETVDGNPNVIALPADELISRQPSRTQVVDGSQSAAISFGSTKRLSFTRETLVPRSIDLKPRGVEKSISFRKLPLDAPSIRRPSMANFIATSDAPAKVLRRANSEKLACTSTQDALTSLPEPHPCGMLRSSRPGMMGKCMKRANSMSPSLFAYSSISQPNKQVSAYSARSLSSRRSLSALPLERCDSSRTILAEESSKKSRGMSLNACGLAAGLQSGGAHHEGEWGLLRIHQGRRAVTAEVLRIEKSFVQLMENEGLQLLSIVFRILPMLILLFVLPLRLGFITQLRSRAWIPLDATVDLIFGLDLVINVRQFIAGLSNEVDDQTGSVRIDWKRALLLTADFASCLPAELPCYALEPLPEWLPLLLIPRLFQLRHSLSLKRMLGDKLRIYAPHSVLSHSMQRITLLLISMVAACHATACVWHFVGRDNDGTWISVDGVLSHSSNGDYEWGSAYLRSLYFTLVAVTTVGYGDIVPTTLVETVVATFIALIGGLLYPAVVGAIAALIEGAGRAKSKQKEEVLEFVRRKQITEPLRSEIVRFAEHGRRSRTEADVLRGLPPSLRSMVAAELHLARVQCVASFQHCSHTFLLAVTSLLSPELFVPRLFMVQSGDEAQSLVFIVDGKAQRRRFISQNSSETSNRECSSSEKTRRARSSRCSSKRRACTEPEDDSSRYPVPDSCTSDYGDWRSRRLNPSCQSSQQYESSAPSPLAPSNSTCSPACMSPVRSSRQPSFPGRNQLVSRRNSCSVCGVLSRAAFVAACARSAADKAAVAVVENVNPIWRVFPRRGSAPTIMSSSHADSQESMRDCTNDSYYEAQSDRCNDCSCANDCASVSQQSNCTRTPTVRALNRSRSNTYERATGFDRASNRRDSSRTSRAADAISEQLKRWVRRSSIVNVKRESAHLDLGTSRLGDGSRVGALGGQVMDSSCSLEIGGMAGGSLGISRRDSLSSPGTRMLTGGPENDADLFRSLRSPSTSSMTMGKTVVVQALYSGSHFGDDTFLLGLPFQYDVVAMCLCECLLLPRAQFIDLLQRFPEESNTLFRNAHGEHVRKRLIDSNVTVNMLRKPKALLITGAPDPTHSKDDCDSPNVSRRRPSNESEDEPYHDGSTSLSTSQLWNVATLVAMLYNIAASTYRAAVVQSLTVEGASVQLGVDLLADLALWVDLIIVQRLALEKQYRAATQREQKRMKEESWRFRHPFQAIALGSLPLIPVDLAMLFYGVASTQLDTKLPSWVTIVASRVRLSRLIICISMPAQLSSLENWVLEKYVSTSSSQVKLFRLLIFVVLIAHIAGCIWASIGWDGLRNQGSSWLSHDTVMGQAAVNLTASSAAQRLAKYGGSNDTSLCGSKPAWTAHELMGDDIEEGSLSREPALMSMLRGFYFSLATVTVVVIGDITPSSLGETIFVLALILFGVAVHSALIGSIVGVLAHLGEEEHTRARLLAGARAYMVAHNIPSSLQARVRDYLEASYVQNELPQQRVFRLLPPTLRLAAAKEMRFALITQTKLAQLFDAKLLARLCLLMQELVVPPFELLLLEGDRGNSMYCVQSGTLEVISLPHEGIETLVAMHQNLPAAAASSWARAASGWAAQVHAESVLSPNDHRVVVLATLECGAVLGETAFFLDTPRTATIRSANLCVVLQLERKSLDDLLRRRSADEEQEKLLIMISQIAHVNASANQKTLHQAEEQRETGRQQPRKRSITTTLEAIISKEAHVLSMWCSRLNVPFLCGACGFLGAMFRCAYPKGGTKCCWHVIMSIALLYLGLSIPYVIGFGTAHSRWTLLETDDIWKVVLTQLAADLLIWVEVGGDISHLTWEERRQLIRTRKGRRSWLFARVIGAIPYDIIIVPCLSVSERYQLLAACLLRSPKMINVLFLGEHIRSAASFIPPQRLLSVGAGRLLQGSVAVLYAAHLFACFWMFTSTWLQPSHVGAPSWIAADLECAPWAYITPGTVYLRATYFAMTILSTVGYGDIRPQTAIETGVMLFEVIVSAAFLSGLVGLVSSYNRNRDFEEESLKAQLNYLYHYMQHRKLPRRLQQRISNYYLLIWSNARVSQEATLQAALPSFIQRDLRMYMHKHLIRSIPVLKSISYFPLKALCLHMRATVALTGDILCEKGSTAEELYFVDFGTLLVVPNIDLTRVMISRREPQHITLNEGGYFGSEMLSCNTDAGPRSYEWTVEAISNCHLFFLTSKAWIKLCETYTELYEISQIEWTDLDAHVDEPDAPTSSAAGRLRRVVKCFMQVGRGLGEEAQGVSRAELSRVSRASCARDSILGNFRRREGSILSHTTSAISHISSRVALRASSAHNSSSTSSKISNEEAKQGDRHTAPVPSPSHQSCSV